jgi:hypothetical protein
VPPSSLFAALGGGLGLLFNVVEHYERGHNLCDARRLCGLGGSGLDSGFRLAVAGARQLLLRQRGQGMHAWLRADVCDLQAIRRVVP